MEPFTDGKRKTRDWREQSLKPGSNRVTQLSSGLDTGWIVHLAAIEHMVD